MKIKIKGGEKQEVFKRIHCKVLVGQKTYRFDFVAKPGRAFNLADIERERGRVIDYIDEKFPRFEFKEVQLLPNTFNYIAIGVKNETAQAELQASEAETRSIAPGATDPGDC